MRVNLAFIVVVWLATILGGCGHRPPMREEARLGTQMYPVCSRTDDMKSYEPSDREDYCAGRVGDGPYQGFVLLSKYKPNSKELPDDALVRLSENVGAINRANSSRGGSKWCVNGFARSLTASVPTDRVPKGFSAGWLVICSSDAKVEARPFLPRCLYGGRVGAECLQEESADVIDQIGQNGLIEEGDKREFRARISRQMLGLSARGEYAVSSLDRAAYGLLGRWSTMDASEAWRMDCVVRRVYQDFEYAGDVARLSCTFHERDPSPQAVPVDKGIEDPADPQDLPAGHRSLAPPTGNEIREMFPHSLPLDDDEIRSTDPYPLNPDGTVRPGRVLSE